MAAPALVNMQRNCTSGISAFTPFVTEGSVRLIDSIDELPAVILRGTGLLETFVLKSVLPF